MPVLPVRLIAVSVVALKVAVLSLINMYLPAIVAFVDTTKLA